MSKNNKEINLFVALKQWVDQPPIANNDSSTTEPIYQYDAEIDNIKLTDKVRDVQLEIDSYLPGTQIYDILDKFAGINSMNPVEFSQIPQLNKKVPQYADIADLPDNVHDLQTLSALAAKKLQELQNVKSYTNDSSDVSKVIPETKKQETTQTETKQEKKE